MGERRIGGFRIVAPIRDGKGSQGSVFRAVCEQPVLPGVAVGETVALKTMTVRDETGAMYARLARRTELLSRINHPNVVRYRGCFAENTPFSSMHVVVMEFLEGQTLKERLAVNPGGLDADEAIKIVDSALAGLSAAADQGIVHRDVKPGNIFICNDGTVKLIDFEISRKADGSVSTASGRFAGTFDYMAPEFSDPTFRGDERSDVFSMGVVMHEVLTGEVPYERAKEKGEQADFAFLSRWSQRQEGLCAIHVRSNVRRLLSNADVVLKKALSEDPATRYASATEFRAGIKTIRFRELRSETHAYRLLRIVGRGGFGEVFKARVRGTGDFVAVKHLLKAAYGDRFRREARVMRQLDDPAFVRFVDYFETQHPGGDEAFLVMAFLPGMPGLSLRDAIKRHAEAPLPIRDVITAFMRYAQALAMMHRKGIFHRDIKPANLYSPPPNPAAAAIMDLGIARDVNGTATSGQVPGTLDYMPPEVILSGSRGDAGMDIYALGLCLYEAISGKTGYPRLPTGPTAFAAFFERVRSRMPPVFDVEQVASNPQLRTLLEDMTALDPQRRIHSAEVLYRRLGALLAQLGPGSPSPVAPQRPAKPLSPQSPLRPQAPSTPARPSQPARRQHQPPPSRPVQRPRPSADPTTVHTTSVNPPETRRDYGELASRHRKAIVAVLVLLGVAVSVALSWNPIKSKIADIERLNEQRRLQRIEQERIAKEQEEKRQERERIERVRQAACNEADEVVRQFDNRAVTLLAAGNAAAEWTLKWRDNADVAPIVADQTNRFAVALADRKARDSRDESERNQERAKDEALAIVEAFQGRNDSTEACSNRVAAWMKKWGKALDAETFRNLAGKIDFARRRREDRDRDDDIAGKDRERRLAELRKAEKELSDEVEKMLGRYADENVTTAELRAEYAVWQNNWGRYRDEQFFKDGAARIAKAAQDRDVRESERAVAAECGKWLDNIPKVTSRDVKNWRGNIDRAEMELRRAVSEGRMSEKTAAEMRLRIAACRKWTVGVIDNKTYRTVEFCGRKIPPVSSGTFVFTNGVPEGIAVTSEGCEPLRVKEDRFDSNAFIVMRMEECKGGTKARIPALGQDVSCLVDGVEQRPGVVELRQGRHRAVYRHRRETYSGVRDFKDQECEFETDASAIAEVPPPSGEWIPSPEFEAAKKNSGLVARGREIVATCESCLAPEPLDTRRRRLERAYGVLNDWKTASALAILGEGVERSLRERYDAERRRVRGYVKNATDLPLSVRTDVATVVVNPGERKVVTFEHGWSGESYASVPGYEFVMLPRRMEDFDCREFTVSKEKLVPTPVKVSLPPLENGVVCRIGGRQVEKVVELRPGEYEGAYGKPDSVTQKFRFTVKIGEPLTLPSPSAWQPSDAMSKFSEAMGRFTSGAVDEAKSITTQIGTIEDPEKRRELEDLKKAIELRERLKEGK